MKLIITITLGLLLYSNVYGQEDKLTELVSQGIELHDQGKYDEAIAKYKEALEIDENSTYALYELAYTYMEAGRYDESIKCSKKVIKQNNDHLQHAYIVLGSSLDLNGNPKGAVKAYEEGISKFPDSNLLYYNLALTTFNTGDYEKSEQSALNAIIAKPTHGSSHIVLASTMEALNQRVKAMLPLYYFLLLEPASNRSIYRVNSLKSLMSRGVEKVSDNKINVNISLPTPGSDDSWSGAEMLVSLLGATKYSEDGNKSEMAYFVKSTESLFSILGELKKDNSDLWWDLYVPLFYDIVQAEHCEAFCYYISQSLNSEEVNQWFENNPDKMKAFEEWMRN